MQTIIVMLAGFRWMPQMVRGLKSAIYIEVGRRIREIRTTHEGIGMSQTALAKAVGTTPNTVSRWESGVYKPSLADLDKLAQVLGVPIVSFFPQPAPSPHMASLMRAAQDLQDEDLKDVVRYALFRRAARAMKI